MSAKPDDITIKLGDEIVALRCTLGVVERINRTFGDLKQPFQRISNFDWDAYPLLIGAIIDKPVVEIKEQVFDAGMDALHPTLVRYIVRLVNGGRDPIEMKDVEEGNDAGNG